MKMNDSTIDNSCYIFLLLGFFAFVVPALLQLSNKLSEKPSVDNLEEVLTLLIYLLIPWPLTLENVIGTTAAIFLLILYMYCNNRTGSNL